MKKIALFTTTLLVILFLFCGLAYADFEITQPCENAYYLGNSEILLSTDSVYIDAYSDIKWYYNEKKVEPIGSNHIITLDSVDPGKVETAVVKAVYEEKTKQVEFKIYNATVIENAVNYLKSLQSSDGSFGYSRSNTPKEEWHYYLAAALGDAGVDINIPKAGKQTYFDYLSSLGIDENSSVGELAKTIYALASMKKNTVDFNGKNLVDLLLDKQKADGTFGEGVYTDVFAIIALNKAGIEIPRKNQLITYFDGLTYNNGLYEVWRDIDTTAKIVRALKILGCSSTHSVIKKALKAINKEQSAIGAVEVVPWGKKEKEPNYDTTAEVVMMLLDLGIDPTKGIWDKNGKNLITAIAGNQDEDGSFKTGYDPKYSTYEQLTALTAYYLKYLTPLSKGNNGSGGSSDSNTEDEKPGSIKIGISVIGKLGDVIYPAKKITIEDNAKYGKTALQALCQTGLDFKTKNDDSYISEINGIKEDLSSTAGWKYKVNGKVPGVSAKNCKLENDDTVLWFWAESAESDLSDQAEEQEENTPIPAMLQSQEQSVSQAVYSFPDVSEEYFAWAKKEIEYLASMGLVNGNGFGKFEPGRGITREETVKMIIAALGETIENAQNSGFKDSGEISSWAVPYVCMAKKTGIIKGFEDNTFRPKQRITRTEMAAVIARVLDYKNIKYQIKEKVQLSDWSSIPKWAVEDIEKTLNSGIIKGNQNGRFDGGNYCARAESAVMIYRMIMLFASLL